MSLGNYRRMGKLFLRGDKNNGRSPKASNSRYQLAVRLAGNLGKASLLEKNLSQFCLVSPVLFIPNGELN